MSERIEFLKRILAEPKDTTVQLAFADWLEDGNRFDWEMCLPEVIRMCCSDSYLPEKLWIGSVAFNAFEHGSRSKAKVVIHDPANQRFLVERDSYLEYRIWAEEHQFRRAFYTETGFGWADNQRRQMEFDWVGAITVSARVEVTWAQWLMLARPLQDRLIVEGVDLLTMPDLQTAKGYRHGLKIISLQAFPQHKAEISELSSVVGDLYWLLGQVWPGIKFSFNRDFQEATREPATNPWAW